MTLNELKYIVTLAQDQHFGRAAERCFVSQPTLSIAVKKLEQELGVALFERTKNSVRVTPEGDQIVAQARRVLEEVALIEQIATIGRDQLMSPLRVAAIYTIGPFLFPHFIPELNRLAPAMPLYLEESFTATLRQKLRRGEIDAAILALPFHEPDVVTMPLYDEPFVVLMHTDHPLAQQEAIEPADLLSENVLLMGKGHCFRDQVLEVCPGLLDRMTSVGAQPVVEGSSLDTLRHMVATKLGITVLPSSAAMTSEYGSRILVSRPFVDPSPFRTVALAWRVSFPRTKAIDVLKKAIINSQRGAAAITKRHED